MPSNTGGWIWWSSWSKMGLRSRPCLLWRDYVVISGRAEGDKGPAHGAQKRVPVGQRHQSKAHKNCCRRSPRGEPATRFNDDSPLPFQPMGSAAMGAIRTQARHVRAGAPQVVRYQSAVPQRRVGAFSPDNREPLECASREAVVNSKVPYTCGGGGIGRRTSLRCLKCGNATGKVLTGTDFSHRW